MPHVFCHNPPMNRLLILPVLLLTLLVGNPAFSADFSGEIDQGSSKGTYKNGKMEGPWVSYSEDGTVDNELTGTYKDGEKVK